MSAQPEPRFVVIGNLQCRRVELFQSALARLQLRPAVVVPWLDLIEGRAALPDVLRPGDVLRIESPGRDWAVEKALLQLGAGSPLLEGLASADPAQIAVLAFDRGRIFWPRQWYAGFVTALDRVEAQLRECPPCHPMNDPANSAVMFDKRTCHARLSHAGVPVPRALGPVGSYEELIHAMRQANCWRVFIKLAHGSSASGVVAYQTSGDRHLAITTVEMVRNEGELRLYNSRQLQRIEDVRRIEALVDELCRHRVHVEQWMPKAGIDGRTFDLRVLVIAGRARHVVARLSRGPMTNLHLLNERGEPARVARRMGDAWPAAMASCEAAMAQFPRSLHGGVDLLVAPGFRRHAVLEVNAFGDLLPGVLCEGQDTYETQISHMIEPAEVLP